MTQNHIFEIFSANCPLCKNVEIIKNPECTQKTYDVNHMDEEIKAKIKKYTITAVPTVIIDGKYKIVGIPDFPLNCGEKLFKKLQEEKSFHLMTS